jgi:SGNH hydrolase-like domain, acetyltransferase AlgX
LRGWLERAAAVLLGTLLAVLGGEAATRLLLPERVARARLSHVVESERGKFCRSDPVLGWEGRPDVQDEFQWADCRHRVVQNAQGFRGPAYGPRRGAAPRVVVLGDSFVWGFGVEEDETFAAVLARATGAEVVNAGVSGYGPDQCLLAWKRHAATWAPDEVVLFVTLANDLEDIASTERYGYGKPAFRLGADGALQTTGVPVPAVDWAAASRPLPVRVRQSRTSALLARSALFALATDALARTAWAGPPLESAGLVPTGGADGPIALHMRPPPAEVEQAWRLLAAIVGTLQEDVRAHGARLTVVAIPAADEVYDDRWARRVAHARLDPGVVLDREEPGRRLATLAQAAGARAVDLLPDLRRAGLSDRRLYYAVNHHWTASGHRVVAGVLASPLGRGR